MVFYASQYKHKTEGAGTNCNASDKWFKKLYTLQRRIYRKETRHYSDLHSQRHIMSKYEKLETTDQRSDLCYSNSSIVKLSSFFLKALGLQNKNGKLKKKVFLNNRLN